MSKQGKIIAVVIGVVVLAGLGAVTKCYLCGSCKTKRLALSHEQRYSLAQELVRIERQEPSSVLREWLVHQTPWVSGQAIMALDNNIDPAGRARLAALSAIYALDSDGLSDDARKGWALVLRDLASNVLRVGVVQTDYIAKSYLMEGRLNDAAATYRLIPEHPAAKLFFGTNPELRSPASR